MYQSAKELAYKAQRKVGDIVENSTGAIVGVVALGSTVTTTAARADVPAGVLTAITTAVTDIGVIGAAIMLVVIAIAGFAWIRRPIK